MHFHGTSDETIGYENAEFSIYGIGASVGTGAEATVETWRNYNQCNTEPEVVYFEDTKNDGLTFEQYTYKNETTGKKSAFIKVNGGVHMWYDGSTNDIDYNTEIYKFFTGQENLPTNINENISSKLDIFPNPANDVVYITANENEELIIYDALNREIARHQINSGCNTIDLSRLTNGSYFFIIDGTAQKIVICR